MKLDKEFAKKFVLENIAVHCKTAQEAEEFCTWMHEQGWEWYMDGPYIDDTRWNMCGSQTCYVQTVTGGRYANYKYYLDHGYTIIPYEDFEPLDLKKHIVIEIFSQDKWIEILNVEMDYDDQFDEIISHLNSGKPTIINGQNIALVINNTSDNMYKVCKNEYQ